MGLHPNTGLLLMKRFRLSHFSTPFSLPSKISPSLLRPTSLKRDSATSIGASHMVVSSSRSILYALFTFWPTTPVPQRSPLPNHSPTTTHVGTTHYPLFSPAQATQPVLTRTNLT